MNESTIKMLKKDKVYIDICNSLSVLSKCQFTNVACIIVNDSGRIISTGVNGTISGVPNCNELIFKERQDHLQWSNDNEIHAEMNAIIELARSGTAVGKIAIYTSVSPCFNCLKHLLGLINSDQVKINKIVYGQKYHRLSDEDFKTMRDLCQKVRVPFYGLDDYEDILSN